MKVLFCVIYFFSQLKSKFKVRKPVHESDQYLSGPPAEHQEEIDNIRNLQKEYLDNLQPTKVEVDGKDVDAMTISEMKDAINEVVMKEVSRDKSEKLITPPQASSTVAPVIENAINKVSESVSK